LPITRDAIEALPLALAQKRKEADDKNLFNFSIQEEVVVSFTSHQALFFLLSNPGNAIPTGL
jgi:hypothetical protein